MDRRTGFTHRTVSGWISDFSSVPRWEPWPSITLDQRLLADLAQAFNEAHTAGYDAVILWGLLCGRSWSSYLPDTVSAERKRLVQTVLAQARQSGLKVLMGMGLYSWGFDEIIAQHPELDGGSPSNMCSSRPEAWEWMRSVLDFVMNECDPDGLSLQSSDQGRCLCDACQELSPLEYHANINDRVASYVSSRWPDKLIEISTWGMDLSNPDELPHVQRMAAHADILNDFNNSSGRRGRQNRRRLIQSLSCAFGTEGGWWVDPPPFWDRLRWFLPISVRNVPYLQELLEDGGDAVQRYILPLVNPGAEVGFLFDGMMLNDIRRDPLATLSEALEIVFEPSNSGARQALIEIWRGVEDAYLDNCREGSTPQTISLTSVHYSGTVPPVPLADRPEYLLRLKPDALAKYRAALEAALSSARQIRPYLGNVAKAALLERTIGLALSDVDRVQAWKLSPV